MLFNSIDFAIFFPIIFILYWFVINKKLKYQNLLILTASYIFYGWWDWRFLSLIFFSSIVDYCVGLRLNKIDDKKKRKILLAISLLANLGLLGFFKYYNFFIHSLVDSFAVMGITLHKSSLNIILPVGISFYTFQTLSYTIDIYRKKLKPTKDIIAFFAFVSFFPQLVAGPIERAKNLLPQFMRTRSFVYEDAKDGLRHVLWGLFKKIVIADTCAIYADKIFSTYDTANGSMLVIGILCFAVQIYSDFSGYSDIAIGTARLLGFNIMRNFAYPYFSRDIAEFWRRWHISLSTWFRDYVYIPMGGSRCSKLLRIRNIIITFTVSGLWHGANWTFVAWGFLNGIYYIPIMLLNKQKSHSDQVAEGKLFPNIREIIQLASTFFLTLIAWVFFRAPNIETAFLYLNRMFSKTLFTWPRLEPDFIWLLILPIIEWFQRDKLHPLQIDKLHISLRACIYLVLAMLILFYCDRNNQAFIYFQF